MADIDIKDLGDAAALADTDKILTIISGLGKNVNWARFKELLISQLPTATSNSNGLLNAYDKSLLFTYRQTINDDLNFNNATSPGTYKVLSRHAGMPEGAYSFGVLMVFNAGNITQIYIPDTTSQSGIYVRQQWTKPLSETSWRIVTMSNATTANISLLKNDLTETIIEEVPVSADIPMTLEETGEPTIVTKAIERYEYSIPKMAEAILKLQKQVSDLKT